MIPKIIHYVWVGKGEFPERNKKFIETWKKHCPDYQIIEWNEDNFNIDNANAYVKQAYKNKKYAFVSDYIRLYALYAMGGIYLDTDVELFDNFDLLLENTLFIGRENAGFLCTAVIGSQKGNEDIYNIMKLYNSKTFEKENGELDLTTNVATMSVYFKQKYNYSTKDIDESFDNLSIYKTTLFSSKDYITQRIRKTDYKIALHHFDNTWSEKNKSVIKKVGYNLIKLLPTKLYFKFLDSYKRNQLKKLSNKI